MQKVLVVGNGAREHAICEALVSSPQEPELCAFVEARNPGIVDLADELEIGDISDGKAVAGFAEQAGVDLAVIGPEKPLAAGVVDEIEEKGVPCASPTRKAAAIETSKFFARSLMDRYQVPGQNSWERFIEADAAEKYIDDVDGPVVVKPIGLTGGKGVKIVDPDLTGQLKDLEEAKEYARRVIEEQIGGQPAVLVEKKLEGEEFTLQTLVDGKRVLPTPLVQDNKFAYEGDTGPFTGSMGSFSDHNHLLPFMTATDFFKAMEVMEKTVNAMRKEGLEFKGLLYGGFTLTSEGPKILEFNARWGDPEAMNVLPILSSDFLELCWAMAEGDLGKLSPDFEDKATVCKYLAPKGYPTNPVKGKKIDIGGLGETEALVHYASVDQREDGIYMSSSRALACTGIADDMESAEKIAERAISRVEGPVFYRRDVGREELVQTRIRHMKRIRRG